MARGTLDEVEAEGDFASGMGIAIGTVIALFAVAIALFVLGQEQPRAAPAQRATVPAKNSGLTATAPAVTSVVDRQ